MSSTLYYIHEIICRWLPKTRETAVQSSRCSTESRAPGYQNKSLWERITLTWHDSVSFFSCSCRNAGIKWKLANIKMDDSRSYCGQQVRSKADFNILQEIAADNEKERPEEVGKLCTGAVFKVGHKFHISGKAAYAYNKMHTFLIRTRSMEILWERETFVILCIWRTSRGGLSKKKDNSCDPHLKLSLEIWKTVWTRNLENW